MNQYSDIEQGLLSKEELEQIKSKCRQIEKELQTKQTLKK